MSEYTKPLPLITTLSKIFWDGCKEKKLLYQKCNDCGEVIFFPKLICPNCMGENLGWEESKGRGKIHTFTVTYDMAPPEFMPYVPYALAIIRLDEGFQFMSNIVECEFEEIKCDTEVEVVFEKATDEITLPKFRPVKN
jgi:uncharacterized protein